MDGNQRALEDRAGSNRPYANYYLMPLIAIAAILRKNKDRNARFHALQVVGLLIAWLVYVMVSATAGALLITTRTNLILGVLLILSGAAVYLVAFPLLYFKVLRGETPVLPIVGTRAEKYA